MGSPRQDHLYRQLPRGDGDIVGDRAREIGRLLDKYSYCDNELNIIELEVKQINDLRAEKILSRKTKKQEKENEK